MKAVNIRHLYKSYAGVSAVKDLSFSISQGELLGLIGPNGAGKSTTIKIILDFMKPDSGTVEFFGHPMDDQSKNLIGYLPEEKGLYQKLTAMDQIIYLASLKGLDKSLAKTRAAELLQQTGMIESKNTKIKNMSKGMAQIIQFIVTIIHDPKLIILDEPFSGLDPVNTQIMKSIVGKLRDEQKAIILSTHQMNQVEELCDRIMMINYGSEVFYGTLRDIQKKYKEHSVLVQVEGQIGDLNGVVEKKQFKKGYELKLDNQTTPHQILDQLRAKGCTILHFEVSAPSLNELFLQLVDSSDE